MKPIRKWDTDTFFFLFFVAFSFLVIWAVFR